MMNATKLKSLPVLGSTKVFESNRPEIGGQDLTVEATAGQSTAWFGRDGALVRSPVVEAIDVSYTASLTGFPSKKSSI